MRSFIYRSHMIVGSPVFDFGIRELLFLDMPHGPVAIALNGASGGIASYAISSSGVLELLSARAFLSGMIDAGMRQSAGLSLDGQNYILTGGTGAGDFYAYPISASGEIGSLTMLQSSAQEISELSGFLVLPDDVDSARILTTGTEGEVSLHWAALTSSSLGNKQSVVLNNVVCADLELVDTAFGQFLVLADRATSDIVVYDVDLGSVQMTEIARSGASQGIGINTPNAFTLIDHGDLRYLVLASGSNAGTLTVFLLEDDGALTPVDHVLDTSNTRFEAASFVDSFEVAGSHFLIAGGGDEGFSLFLLSESGRLVLIETIGVTDAPLLAGADGLALTQDEERINLYTTSRVDGGIFLFSFEVSAWGQTLWGSAASDTLVGTGFNDVLCGKAGNDILLGEDGDDLLFDGMGSDVLTGGNGSDVFVLAADGATDRITDFKPGEDRLDLSDYAMIYTADRVETFALAGGVGLVLNGDILEITSTTGYDLTKNQVLQNAFITPNRPALRSAGVIDGTAVADILYGSDLVDKIAGKDGDDRVFGEAGDDWISGGLGDDRLSGDGGADMLYGDDGSDHLYGGSEDDLLFGGRHRDRLYGQDDDDRLFGGDGLDRLYGGSGNDRLHGDEGDDRLFGDLGSDYLYGGTGDDTIAGDSGNDRLYGQDGNDILSGGVGDDRLYGAAGNDIGDGGGGDDRLFGGAGDDILNGGDDNDRVHGDEGSDELSGGEGWDYVFGGVDDDAIYGASGNDRLYGQDGNDLLDGGTGNDRLYGGAGADRLIGNTGQDIL
ncbi:calcium-binding protein, partial [Celeribacter neptunius]